MIHMEAQKILGLKQERLTLKEKLAVDAVQDALDRGASFADKDAAWRWARHKRLEMVLLLEVWALTLLLVGAIW